MAFLKAFKDTEVDVYIRHRTTRMFFNLLRFDAVTKTVVTLLKDLLCADDCNLIIHSKGDLQLLMDYFSAACDEFALAFSLKKSVVMYQPAPSKTCFPPNVIGKKLEIVDTFEYMRGTP